MSDRTFFDPPTPREQFVAEGRMEDVPYLVWCAGLDALGVAEPHRYGPTPVATCGSDSWRPFYDDGHSPESAWAEDGTND